MNYPRAKDLGGFLPHLGKKTCVTLTGKRVTQASLREETRDDQSSVTRTFLHDPSRRSTKNVQSN